mmetsp:Transcript_14749/g.27306  ORF Transcript_14749/g.27306 Transcript_14749/m.27306 type:complete len:207 (+) Transcript_14749:1182-1802(+)
MTHYCYNYTASMGRNGLRFKDCYRRAQYTVSRYAIDPLLVAQPRRVCLSEMQSKVCHTTFARIGTREINNSAHPNNELRLTERFNMVSIHPTKNMHITVNKRSRITRISITNTNINGSHSKALKSIGKHKSSHNIITNNNTIHSVNTHRIRHIANTTTGFLLNKCHIMDNKIVETSWNMTNPSRGQNKSALYTRMTAYQSLLAQNG